LARLQGRQKTAACGYWDYYIMFAMKFDWTPEQVDDLDIQFLEEITARMEAEAELEKRQKEEQERKNRRAGRGRR
jgi:hypothetical protein